MCIRKLSLFTAVVSCFLLLACEQPARTQPNQMEVRDTLIKPSNSYSEMFFDSLRLEHYLSAAKLNDSIRAQIREFYNVRNYQFAWFNKGIPNEQAVNFWNLQSTYIANTGDSAIYNPFLQQFADSLQQDSTLPVMDNLKALPYELELTRQFFLYATHAYLGSRDLKPAELKWFIPRRKVDVKTMLDSITRTGGRLENYEPVNQQYGKLREYLIRYNRIRESGAWQPIPGERKKYGPGDSLPQVALIKKHLQLLGDLPGADTSRRYDSSLMEAVKKFQSRYGLKEDGIVGGATLREMNNPLTGRIRQLLVNMERIKWVPAEPKGDYLLVNIPNYTLHVFENGKQVFKMNVVVGSTQNHTVIFTGKLKYVVFSPYWNVPPGILKKEVLPGIRRDPDYLEKHNMEWNGGHVRQLPGPDNSLGLVKFLFPNSYNIYLHDTPAKSLFNESRRAFSHGCIRVSEPVRLTQWVLRKQPEWTAEKMSEAMNAGRERFVEVRNDIAVFVGYFTAWVDPEGRLNFRDDVYGHDRLMEERMFGKE